MNSSDKRWTVVVDISDEQDDEAVHAVARLHDRTSDRTAGEGSARLGPVEQTDPVIADQIAAARAVNQLSRRLVDRAHSRFTIAVRRAAESAPGASDSYPA